VEYCGKQIASRSKYSNVDVRRCFRPRGHSNKCDEFPYLDHLSKERYGSQAKLFDPIKTRARTSLIDGLVSDFSQYEEKI
jgi:hypothetical protein